MKTTKMKKTGLALGMLMMLGTGTAFAQTGANTPLVSFTDEQLKPEFTIKVDAQDLEQMKKALQNSIQGLNDLQAMKISINDLYKAGDEKSIYAATQAVGEEFTFMAKKLADMTARVYRLSALIQTTQDATDLYDAYQKGFQQNYDDMIGSLVNPNAKLAAAMKTCVSDMCATQIRDVMNDLVDFGISMNKGIKLQKLDRFNFTFDFKSSLVRASISETFTELNKPNQENSAYRTMLAAMISPFVVAGQGVVKTGDNLARLIAAPKTVQLKLYAKPMKVDGDYMHEQVRQTYRATLSLVDENFKKYQSAKVTQVQSTSPKGQGAEFFGTIGKVIVSRIGAINVEGQVRNMKERGLTKANYVAGFSVEGALLYNHEVFENNERDHVAMAGAQLFPYELHVLADGSNKIVASLAGFLDGNNQADSRSIGHTANDQVLPSILDNVKIAEFIWDNKYTFDNIKSFEFNVFDVNASLPLFSVGDFNGKNDSYAGGSRQNYTVISLRAGANAGWGSAVVDNAGVNGENLQLHGTAYTTNSYGYREYRNSNLAVKSSFSAGLEYRRKTEKTTTTIQANFLYQKHRFYEKTFETLYSDGKASQVMRIQKNPLEQSALQVKLDSSRPLRDGKMRVGVVAQYQYQLYNKINDELNIDLTGNYTQGLTGKIYLKF